MGNRFAAEIELHKYFGGEDTKFVQKLDTKRYIFIGGRKTTIAIIGIKSDGLFLPFVLLGETIEIV